MLSEISYVKKIILVITIFSNYTVFSGNQQNADLAKPNQQTYVEKYKDVAKEIMRNYKIPASITLAQAMIESNMGKNDLAISNNNHFGMLCAPNSYDCYNTYDSASDSFRAHAKDFAENPAYSKLFSKAKYNYIKWAYGLKKYGYATSDGYPKRLLYYIERYKLYQIDDEVLGRRIRKSVKRESFRKNVLVQRRKKTQKGQDTIKNTDLDKNGIDSKENNSNKIVFSNNTDKSQEVNTNNTVNSVDSDNIVANQDKNLREISSNANNQKDSSDTDLVETNNIDKSQEANTNKDNTVNSVDSDNIVASQDKNLSETSSNVNNNQNDSYSLNENSRYTSNYQEAAMPKAIEAPSDYYPTTIVINKKDKSQYYVIQPDDTYYSIAKKFGISVAYLKQLNNAKSNLIIIDHLLKIVGDLPEFRLYTIQKGDSLYTIAIKLKVSIDTLKFLNNIGDNNIIYSGFQLKY